MTNQDNEPSVVAGDSGEAARIIGDGEDASPVETTDLKTFTFPRWVTSVRVVKKGDRFVAIGER